MAPEALVSRGAELGYSALALTDTSDLGGAIRFTLEAERAGIKPIVGAELLIEGHPTVLLAIDAVGYRNLAALVTRSRVGQLHSWSLENPVGRRPSPERPNARTPGHLSSAPLNRDRGHDLSKRYA